MTYVQHSRETDSKASTNECVDENNEITDEERRSFTSKKLDVLDAMSCDPNVTAQDFVVAFRVMQHINARTGQANPSYERIAAQIGVSRDTVMRSINKLSDERYASKWLNRRRSSRTETYVYSFDTTRMDDVIDARNDRVERAKETSATRKKNRDEVAELRRREVADLQGHEVANPPSTRLQDCHPNTLALTTYNEHPDFGSEGGEDTYLRETDFEAVRESMVDEDHDDFDASDLDPDAPFAPPRSLAEANEFVVRNSLPRSIAHEALARLRAGELRPSELDAMKRRAVTLDEIPTDEAQFSAWVAHNIPDRAQHREAYRLLSERKMTPAKAREMAA